MPLAYVRSHTSSVTCLAPGPTGMGSRQRLRQIAPLGHFLRPEYGTGSPDAIGHISPAMDSNGFGAYQKYKKTSRINIETQYDIARTQYDFALFIVLYFLIAIIRYTHNYHYVRPRQGQEVPRDPQPSG